MTDLNADQDAARSRVHELLAELAELLGPNPFDDPDADDPAQTWFLSDWVIVACWIGATDGDSRIVRFGSANLLAHQRDGLLFQGLHRFAIDTA